MKGTGLAIVLSVWLLACSDDPVAPSGPSTSASSGGAGAAGGAGGAASAGGMGGLGGAAGGAGGLGGGGEGGRAYTPCPEDAACRVMPLGASITDGYNVPGGYRIHLWALVPNAATAIDFVGSLANGPPELPDQEHEGHSGWKIAEVDAIAADRVTTYLPDVVLVHVGTNDIRQNEDVPNAPNRLRALVDTLTNSAPDAVVLLSSLVPLDDPADQLLIDAFNAEVPVIATENQAAGKHVVFVDMASALTVADLDDGVHPTAAGYDKMADRWFETLGPLLP